MKKFFLIISLFLSISLLFPISAAESPQYGVIMAGHGQRINFPTPFSQTPVVLTSAQIGGKAVSSCAVDVTPQGFWISLVNDRGNTVPSAWVQWIAFIPDPSLKMTGNIMKARHGQHISFSLPAYPVIITNAQNNGMALISGAMNNSPTGFDLYLVDSNGNPVNDAWVIWGAICPDPVNGFKGEVKLMSNGQNISFTPAFTKGPAYVSSAQPGVIAGAVNNRNDGFLLALTKHDGSSAQNVWVQWLGFAGMPTPPPASSQITYQQIGAGMYYDKASGDYAWFQGDLIKAWIFARAEAPKDEQYSSLRVFDYKTLKVVAPDNNFHIANLTVTVDVKGIVDKIDYVLPVGGSATQYAVKVVTGIAEGNHPRVVDTAPGYNDVVWQKATNLFTDFLSDAFFAIVGGVTGYYIPGYDVFVSLAGVGTQVTGAAESVNGRYTIQFKNIALKGNQTYCLYISLEGVAKAVALGIASGVCEVDFYYRAPNISDPNGDPMGGRGIKIVDYSIQFIQ